MTRLLDVNKLRENVRAIDLSTTRGHTELIIGWEPLDRIPALIENGVSCSPSYWPTDALDAPVARLSHLSGQL